MKFGQIKNNMMGVKSLRALCNDGTILGILREPNNGRISYFINSRPVKNTGKTNKVFSRNIDNFSAMIAHIKV